MSDELDVFGVIADSLNAMQRLDRIQREQASKLDARVRALKKRMKEESCKTAREYGITVSDGVILHTSSNGVVIRR